MFWCYRSISTADSTEKEIALNESLIHELKDRGSFESESATKKRTEVLSLFQALVQEFVHKVYKSKSMTDGMAKDAGGGGRNFFYIWIL